MEIEKVEIYKCLIKWLQILNLKSKHSNVEDLSDGVALAEALNQIAPDNFTDNWFSKIKTDVGTNWRLKVSNLKKIVEGMYDYYSDVLSLNLIEDLRPDVMKIAEKHDSIELGRLLQLILGCAVNCSEKQQYITQIMELEESLQRSIMCALQDIEYIWQGGNSRNSINIVNLDVKTLQDERDNLAQKCYESDKKLSILIEEKQNMQQEINKLQNILDKYENPNLIGDDATSIGPIQLGSTRYNELRKQVDILKDDLLQAETTRDDLKIKSIQQEKEVHDLQAKIDELQQTSVELAQLKDELDILRESNDKLKIYETQLATYKKKLEDNNDLKKQIKMLEERSADYLKQNMQHEEEAKKYSGLKGQVELYKKEIEDLHTKLDKEMSKTVKIEFDMTTMQTKLAGVQREKDNLIIERDALRETCDELKCNQSVGGDSGLSRELHSPDMREKIERLEAENKALREGQGGQTALAQLLDDSNQRTEKLREQLKTANQKILSLSQATSQSSSEKNNDVMVQLKQALELNEQRSVQIDEGQNQITNLHARVTQLETMVVNKDQELAAFDIKYKKCVEKAKDIIKSIDSRAITEAALLEKSTTQEIEDIRTTMGVQEERLVTTAFYRLGLSCQREAVDARLAMLTGQGQSFLSRQRQAASRKPTATIYKK